MKKIFTLICCILLLCSSYLSAQEVPIAQDLSPSDHVRHFSARYLSGFRGLSLSPIHIGSRENPVTVQEYCDFLNDMAPTDNGWFGSAYYDGDLMKRDNAYWNFSYTCIYRTGKKLHYQYTPLAGCDNDIIDAVSHNLAPDNSPIALQFEKWRKDIAAQ